MKALFTFIFIAFFSLQNAMAQAPKSIAEPWVPVHIVGIKGGVNVASVSNLSSSHAFLGFHAGVFGEVQRTSHFGYGGEVQFSKQGVTADNLDFSLNYLSLPLYLNLHHGKTTFQAGAYGSVLFLATAKVGQERADITDAFRSSDYGLLVGLKFRPGEQTFVGVRFNLGMHNINHDFTTNNEAILRNRTLQISGGYQF